MVRRRREVQPDTGETLATDAAPGSQPQGTLTLRGSADALKKQLTGGKSEKDPEEKPQGGNGQDAEKNKFVELLRNPKFIIRVKRTTPREHMNVKTNVEVWQAELPLSYQEIQDEITKTAQGGKYRVAIVDPSSNNTVAADTFEVDGDPFIPENDMSQEEVDRVFMRGQPKSAADITEEGLERRARVTAKQIEVEAYEEQLREARSRREHGGKHSPQDNSKVDELERRLTEAKHQAELENRDRKHAEEMRELKESIARIANAKPTGAADPMMILLEQMREDRKQAQVQFTAILTQMKDDKLNTVIDELKTLKNKPTQQTPMLEMAQTMIQMKKLLGWDGGGDDDDDDDDDKEDDRPWYERAIDKLGGKFGDKFLDKLLDKFNGMEEKGQTVTRDEFIKNMNEEAQRIADEAVSRAQRPALPPPPPPAAPALPPPPPAAGAPAPAIPMPPPPPPPQANPAAAEVPKKFTLEEEILIRVTGVLEILEREMELRPNDYHWNYEGCFLSLPEAILEKVCAAPDPAAMMDAFSLQHINPEKLAEMKAKISGTPRIMAWLTTGHQELKEWFAEKLKDPTFDPFAEDEDAEEEV